MVRKPLREEIRSQREQEGVTISGLVPHEAKNLYRSSRSPP